MLDTRMKVIGGIVAFVAVAAIIYGIVLLAQPKDPYAGLTLWRETTIDDATRATLEQRIATTKASIAIAEQNGEDVDTTLYLSLGNDAYILGDLVTAREALVEALNDNSMNMAVWNAYGNVLNRMNDLEKAEDAYLQAINIGGLEEYYMDYVRFLEQHYPERDQEVLAVLEHALSVVGRTASLMATLSDWYAAHDDCSRAIDHMEVALSLSEGNQGTKDKLAALRTTCAQQ